MLRLVNLVDRIDAPEQAYPITIELAKLAKLLRVHLATEDEWFYPAMIASDDPVAASLAATYRDEVGGVAAAVEAFITQWNSSSVIAIGFNRFRTELIALLRRVEQRIGREDDELYPLAISLGIGQRPVAA